jgi:hypothetical protein
MGSLNKLSNKLYDKKIKKNTNEWDYSVHVEGSFCFQKIPWIYIHVPCEMRLCW